MEFDILNDIVMESVGSIFQQPSSKINLDIPSTATTKKSPSPQISQIDNRQTRNDNIFSDQPQLVLPAKNSKQTITTSINLVDNNNSNNVNNKNAQSSNSSISSLKKANQSGISLQVSASSLNSVDKSMEDLNPKTSTSLQTKSLKDVHEQSVNLNDPTKWAQIEGPKRLKISLAKVGYDTESINKVNLATLDFKTLSKEKKFIKDELKEYDVEFKKMFKREPNRDEKEPMRPLYVYYKRLKHYLAKLEKDGNIGSKNSASTTQQSMDSKNQSINDKYKNVNSNQQHQVDPYGYKKYTQQPGNKSYEGGSGRNAQLLSSFEGNLSRDNSRDKYSGMTTTTNTTNTIMTTTESPQAGQRIPSNGSTSSKGGNTVITSLNLGSQPLTNEQKKKRVESLLVEKSKLREKLHAYQSDFQKANNRKIKYHKDILPVEIEYKRYKEIKAEISVLEGNPPDKKSSGGDFGF